jgi:hypothetical protein
MPKKILEDIKPLTRTRRVSATRKVRASKESDDTSEEEMDIKINSYDSNVSFESHNGGGTKKLSLTLWLVTFASLAFLFIVLSSFFAKATIEIRPKSVSGALDTTFIAKKDTTEDLGFQVMSISDEVTEKVTSSKKEVVENKSKGRVVIYNEFSTSSQNLLIDTRLVASDGKIYKTEKAVVVPGLKKSGKETIPGSVEVAVYADVAGAEYDKETADMKIFGFKGSAKYDKFYARTKGSITGGFKGERYVVESEKAQEISTKLEQSITEKLNSAVLAQIPNGYVVFDNSFVYDIDTFDSSAVYGTTEEFDVTLKGSVVAYIFEEQQIAGEIAEKLTSQYDGSPVKLSNKGGTQMKLDTGIVEESQSIKFKLVGEPTVTWIIDEEAVKNSLIGATRKEFDNKLAEFPGVDTGRATIRPLWKKTFPKSSDKIKVIITEENE